MEADMEHLSCPQLPMDHKPAGRRARRKSPATEIAGKLVSLKT
jgi:hypothetical protein